MFTKILGELTNVYENIRRINLFTKILGELTYDMCENIRRINLCLRKY